MNPFGFPSWAQSALSGAPANVPAAMPQVDLARTIDAASGDSPRETSPEPEAAEAAPPKRKGWPKGVKRGPRAPK